MNSPGRGDKDKEKATAMDTVQYHMAGPPTENVAQGSAQDTNVAKPLEQWSAEEVQQWLRENGYQEYADRFAKLMGKQVAVLQKEDFRDIVENVAVGSALYNEIQGLKQPAQGPAGEISVATKIDPSNCEELLGFLLAMKGVKDSNEKFAKPFQLSARDHGWERQNRDDSLRSAYRGFAARLAFRKGLSLHSAADKQWNPIVALQSAPGGGKSFFLEEVAALRKTDIDLIEPRESDNEERANDINAACDEMKNILLNAVGVCVTYNKASDVSVDEGLRITQHEGIAYRVVWSYFADQDLGWKTFLADCRRSFDKAIDLTDAINVVRLDAQRRGGAGEERCVILCVDELIQASRHQSEVMKLLSILGAQLSNSRPQEFHVVVSTLDVTPITKNTYSQRPIWWVPLPPLRFYSAKTLFDPIFGELKAAMERGDRKGRGTGRGRGKGKGKEKVTEEEGQAHECDEDAERDKPIYVLSGSRLKERFCTIGLCISDCGGHPRSLAALYDVLKVNARHFWADHRTIMVALQESLRVRFSVPTDEVVILALRGRPLPLQHRLDSFVPETQTIADLIARGVYLNTLITTRESWEVIPRLSPLVLQVYAESKAALGGLPSAVAKLLQTQTNFSGLSYEVFHAFWEVIHRLVSIPSAPTTIENFYRLSQPRRSQPSTQTTLVKFTEKEDVIILAENFPPDHSEVITDQGRGVVNLFQHVMLPAAGNPGFDMVIFEKTPSGGTMVFNLECRYSFPASKNTLDLAEVLTKYEKMLKQYEKHIIIKAGSGNRRSNTQGEQQGEWYDKSPVGKLQLTSDDIWLVLCCWRDTSVPVYPDRRKNILVLHRDHLCQLYSPTLASRPHLLYRRAKELRLEECVRQYGKSKSDKDLDGITKTQMIKYCQVKNIDLPESLGEVKPQIAQVIWDVLRVEDSDASATQALEDVAVRSVLPEGDSQRQE